MPGDHLTLILLGAFWAGTSAVFAGVKHANEARDRVIVGRLGDDPIAAGHAWRLLLLDWLPMKLALAAVGCAVRGRLGEREGAVHGEQPDGLVRVAGVG